MSDDLFQGVVFGAIVDDDDFKLRVIGGQQRFDAFDDGGRFVVGGDQDGHWCQGFRGQIDVRIDNFAASFHVHNRFKNADAIHDDDENKVYKNECADHQGNVDDEAVHCGPSFDCAGALAAGWMERWRLAISLAAELPL